MKIGDKVYCINNESNDIFDDDYSYYNEYTNEHIQPNDYNDIYDIDEYQGTLLKTNKTYTIYKILLQFTDSNSTWVREIKETKDESECSIFFELIEICDLCFNKNRFLNSQQYRKLKLQNLNENR